MSYQLLAFLALAALILVFIWTAMVDMDDGGPLTEGKMKGNLKQMPVSRQNFRPILPPPGPKRVG